jgi:hypothetical protein
VISCNTKAVANDVRRLGWGATVWEDILSQELPTGTVQFFMGRAAKNPGRGKGVSADRKAVSLAFQIEALPVAIVVHVSVSDRIVWNGTGETRTYPIEFQRSAKRRVLEGRFRIIAGR